MTVARRAGVVFVALLVVLATFITIPTTSSFSRAAQADGRHDYSYRYCYWEHGYWHCENDGRDWWWYDASEKCHKHDKWYCYDPRGHGREHGHGNGYR